MGDPDHPPLLPDVVTILLGIQFSLSNPKSMPTSGCDYSTWQISIDGKQPYHEMGENGTWSKSSLHHCYQNHNDDSDHYSNQNAFPTFCFHGKFLYCSGCFFDNH